jgi:hypothetical protein
MPEVDAVGDAADPHKRRELKQPCQETTRVKDDRSDENAARNVDHRAADVDERAEDREARERAYGNVLEFRLKPSRLPKENGDQTSP